MDIVELSLKMEANLLASYSSESDSNESFNQRLTRSQTNKGRKQLLQECAVIPQPKRAHREFEVEKNYLNKKLKVVHKNLETIYENPVWRNGNTMLLGTSKVKRSIYLDREFRKLSKQKSKLRKIKIRRLGKRIKPFKISDEEFKKRMLKIEDFLNESSEDVQFKNVKSDVEFKVCEGDQDCSDSGNGNQQSDGNDDSCSSTNREFELVNEFETE